MICLIVFDKFVLGISSFFSELMIDDRYSSIKISWVGNKDC